MTLSITFTHGHELNWDLVSYRKSGKAPFAAHLHLSETLKMSPEFQTHVSDKMALPKSLLPSI